MSNDHKQLGTKGLIFVVLLVLVVIVANAAYTALVLEKRIIYRQHVSFEEFLQAHQDRQVSYGFFGDSHPTNDVIPALIDNDSFNFASSAENYMFTYYKLNDLITSQNVSFDTIVLSFDRHTFSGALLTEDFIIENIWWQKRYTPLRAIRQKVPAINRVHLWKYAYLPVLGNGKDFFHHPSPSTVKQGWVRFNPLYVAENFTDFAQTRYDIHYAGYERLDPLLVTYFQKCLLLAHEHNISVVLVAYPYTQEYETMLQDHHLLADDYYAALLAMVNKTGVPVEVLDYHDLYLNKSDYFANTDHLLESGAKSFSLHLKSDLAAQSS